MGLQRVAKVAEIPAGTIREFQVEGKAIALANVGGRFHAINNSCLFLIPNELKHVDPEGVEELESAHSLELSKRLSEMSGAQPIDFKWAGNQTCFNSRNDIVSLLQNRQRNLDDSSKSPIVENDHEPNFEDNGLTFFDLSNPVHL